MMMQDDAGRDQDHRTTTGTLGHANTSDSGWSGWHTLDWMFVVSVKVCSEGPDSEARVKGVRVINLWS